MMRKISTSSFLISLVSINLALMISQVQSGSGSRRYEGRKSNGTKPDLNEDHTTRLQRAVPKVVKDERDDVELQCPMTYISRQFEWYKQNPSGQGRKRITQFRGRYELSSQGQVRIRSVTFEDSGIYVCKVSNRSEVNFVQLVVNGEDSIKNNHLKPPPSRKGVEEAYSEPQIVRDLLPKEKVYHAAKGFPILLLKCESNGNPKPTITWSKNGEILSSSRGSVSSLKLLNVSHADNGVYKCESVNLFGISAYEVSIQVTDFWYGAAEILELSPRNATILEGATVNISCLAKFETNPWFSWVREVSSNKTESGKVFFHTDSSAYYEVLQSTPVKERGEGMYSTDLILTNVTRNDSGVYYCAVAGLQGYNLSDATITVQIDPSQMHIYNAKGVAAQWAILWTTSFVVLVMLIILCFAKIYGCHSQLNSKKTKPVAYSKAHLPESSPLTMSTHCTTQCQEAFVPLMVGSCSGLSSNTDQFDTDYDSPTASNSCIYSHHFPTVSLASSNSNSSAILGNLESARSYRPNSICSDYHVDTGGSRTSSNQNYSQRMCCNKGSFGIRRNYRSRRHHNVMTYHHPKPKPISDSDQQLGFLYSSWNDSFRGYSKSNLNCDLSSTECGSNYDFKTAPKRKKVPQLRRQSGYKMGYRVT